MSHAPYYQPYCADGEQTSWSRLVTLYDGSGLLLDRNVVQWNESGIHDVLAAIPANGMLVAVVNQPAEQLNRLGANAWAQCPRIGSLIVHGDYIASLRETKCHPTVVRPHGAAVHIISLDFLQSFVLGAEVDSTQKSIAFNTALGCLTDIIFEPYIPHREAFGEGVASRFHEIVCMEHDPAMQTYIHQSFRTDVI